MQRLTASDFPRELLDLFDLYVHGDIDRRAFLDGAQKFTTATLTATAIWESLRPNYAWAQQVPKDDARLATQRATVPSPQGNGEIKGYLVRPAKASGKIPGVLVVHENRGLNPYIEDVARRLGVVGFCFGGGVSNILAVRMGADLAAAVPFYGGQAPPDQASKIKAALLLHYAGNDQRVNAGWPAYEEALKANGVKYAAHIYENTNHGFHNDTTPRYDEAAAKLAWKRTVEFFNQHLRG